MGVGARLGVLGHWGGCVVGSARLSVLWSLVACLNCCPWRGVLLVRWSGVACTVRVRDAEGWGACCVRNLGEAGTFRCYSSGKVRAGKVVYSRSFLLSGSPCLLLPESVPLGVWWCPLFGACFVVVVGEGGCGWAGRPGGWARAGKGVLNVHHMKKRSCITRERCTGYPPLSPDSSSSFVSADLWGRGVLLVEGVIGLVVCLGVAATGGGVTAGWVASACCWGWWVAENPLEERVSHAEAFLGMCRYLG